LAESFEETDYLEGFFNCKL